MGKGSEACGPTTCAEAILSMGQRLKSSGRWVRAAAIVGEFRRGCGASTEKLRQVAEAMMEEMNKGLASEGGRKLKMIISHVDTLPTGLISKRLMHENQKAWAPFVDSNLPNKS